MCIWPHGLKGYVPELEPRHCKSSTEEESYHQMSVVAKNEKVISWIKMMKDGLILGGWIHHGSGEADGGHAVREKKKL